MIGVPATFRYGGNLDGASPHGQNLTVASPKSSPLS